MLFLLFVNLVLLIVAVVIVLVVVDVVVDVVVPVTQLVLSLASLLSGNVWSHNLHCCLITACGQIALQMLH